MSMKLHPLTTVTSLLALIVVNGGCTGSDGGDEGLVLRHLPLVAAREYRPGMVYVVRDQSCWQRSVDDLDLSDFSPETIEQLTLLYEQTLDVDFETEMVVFYAQNGCGVPVNIRRVDRIGNRIWVELTEVQHSVTCMAVWPTQDVVVIPKSDAEVMVAKYTLYDVLLLPPQVFTATPLDGPCTQTAP
jgi:hypothetical protein